jgi:threonylcarbamoyladenosine tRNA methylthiotransferase MtaB
VSKVVQEIVRAEPVEALHFVGPPTKARTGLRQAQAERKGGPELITLGCRLNAAESEAIRALAADCDDLVIVNSCAVTNEAVRQTRQAIRKAKRARPNARVIVTGCAAQVEPETFAAMPEVARVIGNREKFLAGSFKNTPFASSEVEMRGRAQPRPSPAPAFASAQERFSTSLEPNGFLPSSRADIRVSDIMAVRQTAPHLVTGFAERARAFVEVQNGCDHRCTFCIIPYGRGNSRSVPAGLVVERIKALAGEGFEEVVLTGVDVTSYGPDLPGTPSLGQLIERVLRHVPELPRLRLSSLDCIEIDERLFDIAAHEPRFMPHLHLSIQAGDDMVLKRMKRRHSRAQAIETVARLKAARPEIAIGADLIAGFPTETDEMHENSLRLIDECDIVMGHVFPFSPKRGTPAARMPQVPPKVVKERARRLREASARRRAAWLEGLVGTRQRVLIEKYGFGHSENFAPVQLKAPPLDGEGLGWGGVSGEALRFIDSTPTQTLPHQGGGLTGVVEVRITSVEGETLLGEAL